jgi:hypothetical protein
LKKPTTKKGWQSGSGVGPEFKPQYQKKKKSAFPKVKETAAEVIVILMRRTRPAVADFPMEGVK